MLLYIFLKNASMEHRNALVFFLGLINVLKLAKYKIKIASKETRSVPLFVRIFLLMLTKNVFIYMFNLCFYRVRPWNMGLLLAVNEVL